MKTKKSSKRITLPTDYDMTKDGVTQSLISNFFCRQKFIYKVNKWYHPSSTVTTYFGSLVHDVLDKIYTACIKHKAISSSIIQGWITKYDFEVRESELIGVIRTKAWVLIDEYLKYYRDDFTTKKFTQIEKIFNVNFRGFTLKGKKDGRFKVNGKRWLMEHKTKGQINEDNLLLSLSFDFQNLFYVLADEIEYKETVTGVLYNIIRNPQTKPKKGERLRDYAIRLRKDVQKQPEHYFKRYEIIYTEQDKKQFQYELANILWEMGQVLTGKLTVYKNRLMCHSPYNCEFLNACGSGTMAGYKKKNKMFTELQ